MSQHKFEKDSEADQTRYGIPHDLMQPVAGPTRQPRRDDASDKQPMEKPNWQIPNLDERLLDPFRVRICRSHGARAIIHGYLTTVFMSAMSMGL